MILTFLKGFPRELMRLLKDTRGLFLFLIAPLVMNIVVCGAFQNGAVNGIRLAAVDTASSEKTRELIRAFDESDRFEVTAVLTEQREAKKLMEAGKVEGIIVIPEDYTTALQLGQQAEVLVGVNSTNNIVGNSAVVSIMQVVKTISTQIVVKSYVATGSSVAEGTAKAMPISTILRPWFNPQFSYLMYLGLGLTGLVYHQLFLSTVASAFAEEKEKGILSGRMRKRDCFVYFWNKMIFYGITGFAVLLLNLKVIMQLYGFPMRGQWQDILLLSGCFIFDLLGIGALLGMLCKNGLHALQWIMAMTYPLFILSGFSWPHTEMPAMLVQAGNLLPATHYIVPLRNIVLMGIGFERGTMAYSKEMLLLIGGIAFALSLLLFLWKIFRAEKREKEATGEEVMQA